MYKVVGLIFFALFSSTSLKSEMIDLTEIKALPLENFKACNCKKGRKGNFKHFESLWRKKGRRKSPRVNACLETDSARFNVRTERPQHVNREEIDVQFLDIRDQCNVKINNDRTIFKITGPSETPIAYNLTFKFNLQISRPSEVAVLSILVNDVPIVDIKLEGLDSQLRDSKFICKVDLKQGDRLQITLRSPERAFLEQGILQLEER